MIEQTEMSVTEWQYTPTLDFEETTTQTKSYTTLDVMKKRAPTKKGIACRFSCYFAAGEETILVYVGEDSYVIDLEDIVDLHELHIMVRNSYSKFKEKFDFRKLNTVLRYKELPPLDESKIDFNTILPLLF